jgi:transcriptional regulator with XRE-family HTH domain
MLERDAWRTILSSRLRQVRLQRRMTQKVLAARSGITPSDLSRLEAGKRSPAFAEVVALARVLDLPLQWFLTGQVLRREQGLEGSPALRQPMAELPVVLQILERDGLRKFPFQEHLNGMVQQIAASRRASGEESATAVDVVFDGQPEEVVMCFVRWGRHGRFPRFGIFQ